MAPARSIARFRLPGASRSIRNCSRFRHLPLYCSVVTPDHNKYYRHCYSTSNPKASIELDGNGKQQHNRTFIRIENIETAFEDIMSKSFDAAKRHTKLNPLTLNHYEYVIVRNYSYDQDTVVTEVSINNTRKLNSLNSRLMHELTQTFKILNKADQLRCVIIRGEHDASSSKSPAFCAGASIDEMSKLQNETEAADFIERVSELNAAVSECPVPVIAAIHGHCYGAGLELAASCDVRYATDPSKFAMPEVVVGIPSVVQARHLVDIMGWANARYLMMFGKTISAIESKQQGLVNEVFSTPEEMENRLHEDVVALGKCSPIAVRVQKELINSWKRMDSSAGIQASVKSFANMWADGGTEPRKYLTRALENLQKKKTST